MIVCWIHSCDKVGNLIKRGQGRDWNSHNALNVSMRHLLLDCLVASLTNCSHVIYFAPVA